MQETTTAEQVFKKGTAVRCQWFFNATPPVDKRPNCACTKCFLIRNLIGVNLAENQAKYEQFMYANPTTVCLTSVTVNC